MRADVALVDSGSTHYFVLALFRIFGIRVVPILHNALWPNGFPPTKPSARLLLKLDACLFWRRVPSAVIGVSPVCQRQVEQLGDAARYQILQTMAQFDPAYFSRIPRPPAHAQRPFRIIFVGRIVREKGVFDLLEIAHGLEAEHPGLVRWYVCGAGDEFSALQQRHRELSLEGVVELLGWVSPEAQIQVYARSHASIVPTRSSCSEGMAMTAVEAILAGRPLITSAVVPALEVLRDASVEANTDDLESYRAAVLSLAIDRELYEQRRAACGEYARQLYDRSRGLTAVLRKAFSTLPT